MWCERIRVTRYLFRQTKKNDCKSQRTFEYVIWICNRCSDHLVAPNDERMYDWNIIQEINLHVCFFISSISLPTVIIKTYKLWIRENFQIFHFVRIYAVSRILPWSKYIFAAMKTDVRTLGIGFGSVLAMELFISIKCIRVNPVCDCGNGKWICAAVSQYNLT